MGRPKKYLTAQEASAAKRASNNKTYYQRKQQDLRFVLYQPTPDDIPVSTATAVGLRSDIDIPFDPADIAPENIPAVLVSEGRADEVLPLPPPLPPQQLREVDQTLHDILTAKMQGLQDVHEVDQEAESSILRYMQELELEEGSQLQVKAQGEGNIQDSIGQQEAATASVTHSVPSELSVHDAGDLDMEGELEEEEQVGDARYLMSGALPVTSTASAAATATSTSALETVCSVGIDRSLAEYALSKSQGNVDIAFDWIFSQPDRQAPPSIATATAINHIVAPPASPMLQNPSDSYQYPASRQSQSSTPQQHPRSLDQSSASATAIVARTSPSDDAQAVHTDIQQRPDSPVEDRHDIEYGKGRVRVMGSSVGGDSDRAYGVDRSDKEVSGMTSGGSGSEWSGRRINADLSRHRRDSKPESLSQSQHVTKASHTTLLSSPSIQSLSSGQRQSTQSRLSSAASFLPRLGSTGGSGSGLATPHNLSTSSRRNARSVTSRSSSRSRDKTKSVTGGSARGYNKKLQIPSRGQGLIVNWLQKLSPVPPSDTSLNETRSEPGLTDSNPGSGSGSGIERPRIVLPTLNIADAAVFSQWGRVPSANEAEPPIAIQLARQLWEFHGCSIARHQQKLLEVDPEVNCHSLSTITSLLNGSFARDRPERQVPDILSQGDQLLSRGQFQVDCLDWRAMFEGRPSQSQSSGNNSSTATATASPYALGLDKWHTHSSQDKIASCSFDIDSLCAFPLSLGVARLGIEWLPRHYESLQLKGSVHLGLEVTEREGAVARRVWRSLHQIRHYCFGSLVGMPLWLYVFFPEYDYHKGKEHSTGNRPSGSGGSGSVKYSTTLHYEDEVLFLDQVILPALHDIVKSSNILQHYPTSAAQVKVDVQALSKEQYVKGNHSREQLISYKLQPSILDLLWEDINRRIATATAPEFRCFRRPTLFLNGKNSKTHYMDSSLLIAMSKWRDQWTVAVDPAFINRRLTYLDLGKQLTSPDTHLPSRNTGLRFQAETYLYRKCCLDTIWEWFKDPCQTSTSRATDPESDIHSTSATATHSSMLDGYIASERVSSRPSSPLSDHDSATAAAINPKVKGLLQTYYPWATLRDTGAQTITATPSSKPFQQGYIYSQFYNLIKGPFDSTKVYVFQNENIENLALDPAYIETLKKVGGADSFSTATATASYLHSKERASVNIDSRQNISHGIREEHRISLELFDQICLVWQQWEDQDNISVHTSVSLPLPPTEPSLYYYTFANGEILDFLHAQLNKYCLLFEHVLANTNQTHSLPEFLIMVLALRSLRFSYSSSLLARESLLYKDEWVVRKGEEVTQHSGIGMAVAMAESGIGWYLPKINWSTFRVLPPFSDRLLAGNLLLHSQYHRRWRAVRDLRDVYIRLRQVEEWAARYQVTQAGNENRRQAWLDFLTGLNLNQFDHDTATAMLKNHHARPELANIQSGSRVASGSDSWMSGKQFCYRDMRYSFQTDTSNLVPPHCVTSNKGRFKTTQALVDFLFDEVPGYTYGSWKKMTYRLIYKKTVEIVGRNLGKEWQCQWEEDFKFLFLLTHWVLPYASPQSFFTLTKTNRGQGLIGRACWYSTVYQEPFGYIQTRHPTFWPEDMGRTLRDILRFARTLPSRLPLPLPDSNEWQISSLLGACASANLTPELLQQFSLLGRQQDGVALEPIWERGRPPQLEICERIRDRTLDELEQIFADLILRQRYLL